MKDFVTMFENKFYEKISLLCLKINFSDDINRQKYFVAFGSPLVSVFRTRQIFPEPRDSLKPIAVDTLYITLNMPILF